MNRRARAAIGLAAAVVAAMIPVAIVEARDGRAGHVHDTAPAANAQQPEGEAIEQVR
jgi:hypothetical protein